MSRFSEKSYQTRVIVAMLLYVVVLLVVWPYARTTTVPVLKVLLALLPTAPVLYVIWQMARRVWHSDELQQRTHLIALGASTAVVGVATLIGGFLAAAGVVSLDGSILVWVFPTLLIGYYVAQGRVARHYGNTYACDEGDVGIPARWRWLMLAGLMLVVGWVAWRRGDAMGAGIFAGIALVLVLAVLLSAVIHWRQRTARVGQ